MTGGDCRSRRVSRHSPSINVLHTYLRLPGSRARTNPWWLNGEPDPRCPVGQKDAPATCPVKTVLSPDSY